MAHGGGRRHALEGLRVLDFGAVGVGPICAMIFAHYGAQVIKIESTVRPDPLRSAQPIKPGKDAANLNASGYFNNFNSNKLSITLNMRTAQARAVACDLVAKSDVVIENFRPGTLESWNLGYEELKRINPAIIVVRLPMAGATGPHRDHAGYGRTITPVAGLNFLTGFPQRAPVGLGTNYADFVVNPGHGAVGALAALHYRNRTGCGQEVEVAQIESTAAVIGPALLDYAANGHIAERAGNRSDYSAPYGAFRCAGDNRWLVIAVGDEHEWELLCRAAAHPEWLTDARFASLVARKRNEDALEAQVSAWTCTQTAEELMMLLQAAGVPAGVVQNARDLLENDPHLAAREYYRYLAHPETGRSAYDQAAARLSETPVQVHSPAPLLGEHNEYVLREVLGYGEDEIEKLLVAGAIE